MQSNNCDVGTVEGAVSRIRKKKVTGRLGSMMNVYMGELFHPYRSCLFVREGIDLEQLRPLLDVEYIDEATDFLDDLGVDPEDAGVAVEWVFNRISVTREENAKERARAWADANDLREIMDGADEWPEDEFLEALVMMYGPFKGDSWKGRASVYAAGYLAGKEER